MSWPTVHKCLWLALPILAILANRQVAASRNLNEMSMMVARHEQWMARHERSYEDAAEKAHRFAIFKTNLERIESFNAENHKFRLGVNRFADLTNEEFRTRNGFKPSKASASREAGKSFKYENVSDVPATMDWRTKGAVTPIKDQGQCGSCWAFSAVATTEGITKLSSGKLVSLSEQELVDCDVKGTNQGCNGGKMDIAFKFIINNKGLATESDYPYTGYDGTCNAKKASFAAASITGYEDVPVNNESALLKAAANQPIAVAIDAGDFAFQMYESGVFTSHCGTNLNHGVALVGYGTSTGDGSKHWLVKNSWGSSWGENGYIRMERGIDAKEGICGIAMEASYPTA